MAVPRLIVTPETIAIDGVPALIQAGVVHYYRLPHPDLWRGVLERLRSGGFNTVLIPFPWAYHSPAPGFHDFTGPRDLPRLLDEAARAGLWLVPHLGPWVDANLDRGGVPAWAHRLPGMRTLCDRGQAAEPPTAFLRHLSKWWDHLLGLVQDRPNLIALAVDPGPCSDGSYPAGLAGALLELLGEKGVRATLAVPEGLGANPGDGHLPLTTAERRPLVVEPAPGPSGLACVDLTRPGAEASRAVDGRSESLLPFARGASATLLTPVHTGVDWGWWAATDAVAATEDSVLIGGSGALPETYYRTRRLVVALETMGEILADSGPGYDVRAEPEGRLLGARSGRAGTIAFLRQGPRDAEPIDLRIEEDDHSLRVEGIALGSGEVAVLPLNWSLADSRVLATSMEPVLHTVVAGRELLVLQNVAGGELLLPADLRPRHRRGAVVVERLSDGLRVRFDPGKIASLVLDCGRRPLQLLALAPHLAARVWPLDDQWRTTPYYPAAWHPKPEEPARGVIIGPDFVLPQADGGFRLPASAKGFGYRWGPWRGSDPHTWLSPLVWSAPGPVSLPRLTWDARRGAPEVLPETDDSGWHTLLPGGPLSPDAQGIDYGLAWYRAHIEGTPRSVTLMCQGACDLFLNGDHIASLTPPPGGEPVTPKTLPLPMRNLRPRNVLAILVEAPGRAPVWDQAAETRGLIACDLEGGQVVRWCVRPGLIGERQVQGFHGFADWDLVDGVGAADITWHRSRFDLRLPQDVEGPLYLVLDRTPGKCYIYLNGMLIGRMWDPALPQRRFQLPDGVLHRAGSNELLIAQWTRGAEPGIGMAHLETGTLLLQHDQEA